MVNRNVITSAQQAYGLWWQVPDAPWSASLADLRQHKGIVYSNRGTADWRFKAARQVVTVRPESVVLRVNNGLLMRDAAVAGLGIALLPAYFIQSQLARKQLAAVDVGAEPEGATLYIAYPYDRRGSAKIRALTGFLREAFGNPPYWDAPAEARTVPPRIVGRTP